MPAYCSTRSSLCSTTIHGFNSNLGGLPSPSLQKPEAGRRRGVSVTLRVPNLCGLNAEQCHCSSGGTHAPNRRQPSAPWAPQAARRQPGGRKGKARHRLRPERRSVAEATQGLLRHSVSSGRCLSFFLLVNPLLLETIGRSALESHLSS